MKISVRKRADAMKKVIAAVDNEVGSGTLTQLTGSKLSIPIPGVWSTGLETVDAAWGRGGAPRGRTVILHGKEGSGKTTIALTICGSAQADGAIILYIDAEFKLDLGWCPKCGLNPHDIILSQPDYLERACATIAATMTAAQKHGLSVCAVLDSMNACDTKAEFENTWEEEEHYGPKARVYSRVLPKLVPVVKATDSLLILVSQTRGGPTGDHIACGNAPKFYSSSIGKFYKPMGHQVKGSNGKTVATQLEVEWIKNQVAPPYQKALFRITGDGPDRDWAMLEEAKKMGLVKAGSAGWTELPRPKGEPVKFQGVNGWRKVLEKRPELGPELFEAVRARYNVVEATK
jgi:recombination protein RecA